MGTIRRAGPIGHPAAGGGPSRRCPGPWVPCSQHVVYLWVASASQPCGSDPGEPSHGERYVRVVGVVVHVRHVIRELWKAVRRSQVIINVVGINANSTESAADVKAHAAEKHLTFPILKDNGSKIADMLGATRTPEAYFLDASNKLLYHGRIDNSRDITQVNQSELRDALQATLAGKPVPKTTASAFGCWLFYFNKRGRVFLQHQLALQRLVASS